MVKGAPLRAGSRSAVRQAVGPHRFACMASDATVTELPRRQAAWEGFLAVT